MDRSWVVLALKCAGWRGGVGTILGDVENGRGGVEGEEMGRLELKSAEG